MTNYPPPPPPPGYRPMPHGQPAPRRPWWKAVWVIAIAAAIVGLIVGAATAGTSPKTKTVAGPTTHETVTATATATATIRVTTTPTKVIATHTTVRTVTYTPPPPKQYGEGTYVVGTDIKPGVYKTTGGDTCYWARLSSLNTTDIIDNNDSSGPQTVQVKSSDKAFQVIGSCTFGRIG